MNETIESIMQAERKRPPTFEQVHPFRVPLPDGMHIRFTCLQTAAESAACNASCVIDERSGGSVTYDNAECVKLYNARSYPIRQEDADATRP